MNNKNKYNNLPLDEDDISENENNYNKDKNKNNYRNKNKSNNYKNRNLKVSKFSWTKDD